MAQTIREKYWPSSDDEDALFVAGRRALASFMVPTGLVGIILSALNLPFFALFPISISFGFLASFFCLLVPAVVPHHSSDAFQKGALLLITVLLGLLGFIF